MKDFIVLFLSLYIYIYSLDGLLWIIEGFEAIRGQLQY